MTVGCMALALSAQGIAQNTAQRSAGSSAQSPSQSSGQNAALAQQVDAIFPEAQTLYLDLHEHPELIHRRELSPALHNEYAQKCRGMG